MAVDWKLRDAYAFMTERARTRAPQIIDYAAATGAAFLVAPSGAIAITGGAATDIDVERIARVVAHSGSRDELSFEHEGFCVHAVAVRGGFTLCVLSTGSIAPALVAERAKKAAYVLGLALADCARDGSRGGRGSGGAPAEARVAVPFRRKT